MQDIANFLLKLRTPKNLNLPPWLGRAGQAAYLKSLERLHPELSKAVHDSNGIKPYTVSTLLDCESGVLRDRSPSKGGIRGQEYYLRVTTLHPDVTGITRTLTGRWLEEGFTLLNHHFTVESVDVQTAAYATLVQNTSGPRLPRRMNVRFLSPTVFKKTGDIQVPLPLPSYVFGSLIQRWQAFSQVPLCDDLEAFVEQSISIRSHNIRTHTISFERSNRGIYTGFRGEVEFYANAMTGPHFNQLHTLLAFAPFSGIGSHTTVGLGRVEMG